jgi:hypothetical protein
MINIRYALPMVAACAAMSLMLNGCGDKPADATKQNSATSKTIAQAPNSDPGRNIDETFLPTQREKRIQLEQMIQSFWNDKSGDPKTMRKLILSRKGEILTTKRNIRNSQLFTDAQKDSLIKSLDEESLKLATDLSAFSQQN